MITAKLEFGAGRIRLISSHIPANYNLQPISMLLRKRNEETNIIISSTAGSPHPICGSPDISHRGESLFEFNVIKELFVYIRRNPPLYGILDSVWRNHVRLIYILQES